MSSQSEFDNQDDFNDMFANIRPVVDEPKKKKMFKIQNITNIPNLHIKHSSAKIHQQISKNSYKIQQDQLSIEEVRERSRDNQAKKQTNKISSAELQLQNQKIISLIDDESSQQQEEKKKQNGLKSRQNQINPIDISSEEDLSEQIQRIIQGEEKKKKFQDQLLYAPIETFYQEGEEREEKKREVKKIDKLFDKKIKEIKHGKQKDRVSAQVFNAIEDYFS